MQVSRNSSSNVCALTPRQIREAVPESRVFFDSLSKDLNCKDVADLQTSLKFRSRKDLRPLRVLDMGPVGNTCIGLGCLAAGTALALNVMMDPLTATSLIIAVPLMLMGGGLVKQEYSFKKECENAEGQLKQLNQFTRKALESLGGPGPTPDTYRNGNIWAEGVFSQPQEIRRKADGQVLERSIEIKTPNPVRLTEDTTQGTVTIATRAGTFSALGSLELPTKDTQSVTIKSPQVSQTVHIDGTSFANATNGSGGLVNSAGVHEFKGYGPHIERQTNWESGLFHVSPRDSRQPSSVVNPFIHGKELASHFVSYLPDGSKATPLSEKVFAISNCADPGQLSPAAPGDLLPRGESLQHTDADGAQTEQLYFQGGRFNLRQDLASQRLTIQGPDGVEHGCDGELLQSGVVQLERPDGVLTQHIPEDGLALDFQTSQGRVEIRREFQGGTPEARLYFGDDDRGPIELTRKGDDYCFDLESTACTLTPPVPEKVLEAAYRAAKKDAKSAH